MNHMHHDHDAPCEHHEIEPSEREPEPSSWAAMEVFVDQDSVDTYDAGTPLWLAKEVAYDIAIEYPGQTVRLYEQQALQYTYHYDPEDGMEIEG